MTYRVDRWGSSLYVIVDSGSPSSSCTSRTQGQCGACMSMLGAGERARAGHINTYLTRVPQGAAEGAVDQRDHPAADVAPPVPRHRHAAPAGGRRQRPGAPPPGWADGLGQRVGVGGAGACPVGWPRRHGRRGVRVEVERHEEGAWLARGRVEHHRARRRRTHHLQNHNTGWGQKHRAGSDAVEEGTCATGVYLCLWGAPGRCE